MDVRKLNRSAFGDVTPLFGLNYAEKTEFLETVIPDLDVSILPFAVRLGEEFEKIDTVLVAINQQLSRFVGLLFGPSDIRAEDIEVLLLLESGGAALEIESRRAPARRIEPILAANLARWLATNRPDIERALVEDILIKIERADLVAIEAAQLVNRLLMQVSVRALDAVRSGEIDEANAIISQVREDTLEFRRKIIAEQTLIRRFSKMLETLMQRRQNLRIAAG